MGFLDDAIRKLRDQQAAQSASPAPVTTPTTGGIDYQNYDPLGNYSVNPDLSQISSPWDVLKDPQLLGEVGASGTVGEGIDKTLQAQIALIRPFLNLGYSAIPSYAQFISGENTSPEIQNAEQALSGLFGQITNFDPTTSDAFRFREEQLNRQINQRLAAAGKLDSRQGLDVVRDANLALTGDELSSQLGRLQTQFGLGQNYLAGLYNQSEIPYQRLLDAIKIGTGQAGVAGQNVAQARQAFLNQAQQILQAEQNEGPSFGQQLGGSILGYGLGGYLGSLF